MTATTPERMTTLREIQTAARHMAVYGVGGILVKALGFVMIPFYTHYLTPADYGILEILDLSMSLLALIVNMGLTPALLRSYAAADTEEKKQKVISSACVFAVVTGAIMLFLGMALIRPATMALFGPKVPPAYVLLSFGSLILSYAANPARTYLRALEASGVYTLIDTAGVVLLLLLNIVFIAGWKIGLAGVLWSSVIVGGLQFVLLSGWAFRRAGFGFAWHSMRRMLAFGFPLVFGNIGLFVLNFSDRFFLQHFRSLDVVGVYALGYKFGFMLNYLVVQPFFVMWQSRMYAIHGRAEHIRIFQQIFALYSCGLIYAGLAMSLFSSEVVGLMAAPQFAASRQVVPVVVLSYVFYGLTYYAQLGMFLTDRTRDIGVIGAAAAGVNVVANYFLIGTYGMMGAAWATCLSFAFLAVASYWRSQLVLRLPLGVPRMWAAMILAVALYLGCQLWLPPGAGITFAAKVLALGAFPAVVWKGGILCPSAAATVTSGVEGVMAAVARVVNRRTGRAIGQGDSL